MEANYELLRQEKAEQTAESFSGSSGSNVVYRAFASIVYVDYRIYLMSNL